MSCTRALLGLALATAIATALAGCGPATPVPSDSPTPTSAATFATTGDGVLRIGDLYPASGAAAFLGPAQAAGVNLAIADINAAGGVNGKPVEVVNKDTADASSTTVESSFAALVDAKVDVVVGPNSSVLAQRVVPLAVKAKIPVISPAATYPGLTTIADSGYFFRTIPTYEYQGTVLGTYLSASGPVKVALVFLDDDLGEAIEPTLRASLEAAGSTLLSLPFAPKDTDFSALITKITDAKPDVVVLSAPFSAIDQSKVIIPALTTAGYGVAKLWLTSQAAADYSQALPAGLLNGVNGIIDGFRADDAFIARLKQVDSSLGETRYAAEAYDATILAALAATVAHDDGAAAIQRTLPDVSKGGIKCGTFAECLQVLKTQPNIDYDGISGPVNFTDAGDVTPGFYGLYAYNSENKFVFQKDAFGR